MFLERISAGKLNLYACGKSFSRNFFIQDSNDIAKHPQKIITLDENYRQQLQNFVSDCLRIKEGYFKRIYYNELHFRKLIDYYNTGCERPVNILRYGVLAGIDTRQSFLNDPNYMLQITSSISDLSCRVLHF
ncbi:MAG: hypothetical protein JEZ03_10175 [Bacteroidales bacterium]|nr:hypothetical protein [Bacteroidales bacterium]